MARRDLGRTEVDSSYLASLGDDAVPAIVDRLDRLDPTVRADLTSQVCARRSKPRTGLLAWNLATSRASAARRTLGC